MPTSCSAPNCSNTSSEGYTFKLIPNECREEWIAASQKCDWNPPKSGRLCEVHFNESDVCKVDGKKFICKHAVPTAFCLCPKPPRPVKRRPLWGMQVPLESPQKNILGDHNYNIQTPKGQTSISDHTYMRVSTSAENVSKRGRPSMIHSSSCVVLKRPIQLSSLEEAPLGDEVTLLPALLEKINEIPHPLCPLTSNVPAVLEPSCAEPSNVGPKLPRAESSKETILLLQKAVKEKEAEIACLQKKVETLERDHANSSFILNKTLLPDQQKAVLRGTTRGSKWSDDSIKKGLELRFACGTTGYKRLIESVPLPSVRTLQERMKDIKFEPGILEDVFLALEVIVPNLTEKRKICALVFDEMAIQQRADFDRSTNSFIGYCTLDGALDELATKSIAFQLVGLEKRWKQFVGYHFTPARCLNDALRDFIIKLLQRCRAVGLRVFLLICDMGNRGLLAKLGFNTTRDGMMFIIPNPADPEKPLMLLPDPVHAFKNLKEMHMQHQLATIPSEVAEQVGLTSTIANFAHVDWLEDYQANNCKELKFAPKLKKSDLHPTHFMKMKVKTTTNVINLTTAAAMNHLAHKGVGPENMRTTAWLIKLLRKFFDLVTGRTLCHALSFHNKEAYDEAINIIRLISYIYRRMQVGRDGAWKPAQTHIIICAESVLKLQEELLVTEGFTFVCVGQANQDNMENGFSNVRRGRPKPSAMDFKYSLKSLTVVGQDMQVANASYESSETPSLIEFLLKLDKSSATTEDCGSTIALPPLSECAELSPDIQEVLYRMCGYVILKLRRSIKCHGCYEGLQDGSQKAASVSAFVTSTDYKEGAQVRVSLEVFHLLSGVERIMWESKTRLAVMGKSTKEQLCAHFSSAFASYELFTCHDVKPKVISRYVSMRLRQFSTVLTDHYAQKEGTGVSFSSRTMCGGVLTGAYTQKRKRTV